MKIPRTWKLFQIIVWNRFNPFCITAKAKFVNHAIFKMNKVFEYAYRNIAFNDNSQSLIQMGYFKRPIKEVSLYPSRQALSRTPTYQKL